MPLEITFLGTGGAFTDYRVNYHNNAVVRTDAGPVLLDCGGTALQSLRELDVHAGDVAGVVVTHMHGDHTGGIEQLIWERYYTSRGGGPGWKRTPIHTTAPVHAMLRRSLLDCVDDFTASDGETRSGGYDELVDARVLDGPTDIGGVTFELVRTPHVVGPGVDKPAYGIRVRSPGSKGFYYTSDTTFRPDIGERFPDADVIFHDCAFYPHFPSTVHTHYTELLTLPADVRARVVLMHHTRVPDGVDVARDGFRGAARRHETFSL